MKLFHLSPIQRKREYNIENQMLKKLNALEPDFLQFKEESLLLNSKQKQEISQYQNSILENHNSLKQNQKNTQISTEESFLSRRKLIRKPIKVNSGTKTNSFKLLLGSQKKIKGDQNQSESFQNDDSIFQKKNIFQKQITDCHNKSQPLSFLSFLAKDNQCNYFSLLFILIFYYHTNQIMSYFQGQSFLKSSKKIKTNKSNLHPKVEPFFRSKFLWNPFNKKHCDQLQKEQTIFLINENQQMIAQIKFNQESLKSLRLYIQDLCKELISKNKNLFQLETKYQKLQKKCGDIDHLKDLSDNFHQQEGILQAYE